MATTEETTTAATTLAAVIPTTPQQFILQSFNAFDEAIASAPWDILNYTLNNLIQSVADDQISLQTAQGQFKGVFSIESCMEATSTSIAASMGMSASYASYSGSVQANYSKETQQTSTSLSASNTSVINCGTISYNNSTDYTTILSLLKPSLVTALKSISSLKDAQIFIEQYGTHLITGLNLGGIILTTLQISTQTYAEQQSASATVKAAYNGADSSADATATATSEVTSSLSKYSADNEVKAVGGNSAAAFKVSLSSTTAEYDAFAESCTVDTVYGVYKSLEYWKLIQSAYPAASNTLLEYINLFILAQSVNHPTVISNTIPLGMDYEAVVLVNPSTNSSVKGSKPLPAGYKVVSGGAQILPTSATAYLTASFPTTVTSNGIASVSGWEVNSDDLKYRCKNTDTLTAYALCIYDPGNLLKVVINHQLGTHPGSGTDTAIATLDTGAILVGGGTHCENTGGIKFIVSTYPSGDYSQWTSEVKDCHTAASNVVLTSYAVGVVAPQNLKIYPSTDSSTSATGGSDHTTVNLGGIPIIGGGAKVVIVNKGSGNLLQQSYPSSANSWSEFNKTYDGAEDGSTATATVFGIGLTASISYS
jgi:hypothetical protein